MCKYGLLTSSRPDAMSIRLHVIRRGSFAPTHSAISLCMTRAYGPQKCTEFVHTGQRSRLMRHLKYTTLVGIVHLLCLKPCDGSLVTNLTAANFENTIQTSPVTLVMFYDKKCGICVDFGPKYELVARELPKVCRALLTA